MHPSSDDSLFMVMDKFQCSRRHPMFVIRSRAIVENRLHRVKVVRIRIQPRLDFFLDRIDAAVVIDSGNFWRRFVNDPKTTLLQEN